MKIPLVSVTLHKPEYGKRLREVFQIVAGSDFFEDNLESAKGKVIGIKKAEFGEHVVAVIGVGDMDKMLYTLQDGVLYSKVWIVAARANHATEEAFVGSLQHPAFQIFEKIQKVRDEYENKLGYSNI